MLTKNEQSLIFNMPPEVIYLILFDKEIALIGRLSFKATCSYYYATLEAIKPFKVKLAACKDHFLISKSHCLYKVELGKARPWRMGLNEKLHPHSLGTGEFHYLTLYKNGIVEGFGNNQKHQLGMDTNRTQSTPVSIGLPSNTRIQNMAVGCSHTLLLGEDNKVYSFGENLEGNLGLGEQQGKGRAGNIFDATPINLPKDVIPRGIYTYYSCSFIIDHKNQVYAFGSNEYGQLGVGDYNDRISPTLITGLPEGKIPIQIGQGYSHTLILFDDASLYGFGDNRCGQLGKDPSEKVRISSPVEVILNKKVKKVANTPYTSIALAEGNEIYLLGNLGCYLLGSSKVHNPTLIRANLPKNINIVDMVASNSNIVMLCNNEDILVLGGNTFYKSLKQDVFTTPTLLSHSIFEDTDDWAGQYKKKRRTTSKVDEHDEPANKRIKLEQQASFPASNALFNSPIFAGQQQVKTIPSNASANPSSNNTAEPQCNSSQGYNRN